MNSTDHAGAPKTVLGLFGEMSGPGGIQEAGRATAAALAKIASSRGWKLELLSLNDPRGEIFFQYDDEVIRFTGFRRAKFLFVLVALAKALAARRDIVIVAAHPNLAVPASYIKRLLPRSEMLVMAHGVEVWTALPKRRRRALQQAQMVLAPSNYTAAKLADVQHISKTTIERLPWPLSPDFLRLADASSKLPLPRGFPQGRIVLTVGRWASAERYKGTDELILATAQLVPQIPVLHLVVAGSGDDLPRLRKLAAERLISDRVHFFENPSREELAACYYHADIFALPSTGEGFGLVFLEAMAFAKPVVAANAGGATDIVRDGVNGLLVTPHDIEQLAQSLQRLLEDDALRKRLGDSGAVAARKQYQFDGFRRELEEIIRDSAAETS